MEVTYNNFLNNIVTTINTYSQAQRNNFMAVAVVFNITEETGFPVPQPGIGLGPNNEAVDYSPSFISGFQSFLRTRYTTITNLNAAWTAWTPPGSVSNNTANFSDFSDINFNNLHYIDPLHPGWNWYLDVGNYNDPVDPNHKIRRVITNYDYYVGRRDWIDYKQQVLKQTIDEFAGITHSKRLSGSATPLLFGIQPGPIATQWGGLSPIENEGFYDFTPLAENVDWMVQGYTIECMDVFPVETDLFRSICNFWTAQKGTRVRFASETNWPYNNYPPAQLCNGWQGQAEQFRQNGSSANFIMGWNLWWGDSRIPTDFSTFFTYLKTVSGQSIHNPTDYSAVYISTSRQAADLGMMFPEITFNVNNYPYYPYTMDPILTNKTCRDILPGSNYAFKYYCTTNNITTLNSMCDFVTDFMLQRNSQYIGKYTLYFPNGSFHIYPNIISILLSNSLKNVPMYNATKYGNRYWITPGTQSFAGTNSSNADIICMLWRTIPQHQATWPAANKNRTAGQQDYIEYLVNNESTFLDNILVPLTYQNWNPDLQLVYQRRSDLRSIFLPPPNGDGYHGPGWTLLDWMVQYGVNEEPTLAKYKNWPYSK